MNEARPSVDDRYAIGTCARCTPPPTRNAKGVLREQRFVTLVRQDNAELQGARVTEAKEQRRRRLLVEKLQTGKLGGNDSRRPEAERILGEWLSRA